MKTFHLVSKLSLQLIFFLIAFNFDETTQLNLLNDIPEIRDNLKDINIGVLSALTQPTGNLQCNNSQYAINPRFLQSLYFLEQGISEFNKNKEHFFNFTIGYVFMDTCNTIGESIDTSLKLIPKNDEVYCINNSSETDYFKVQAVIAPTSSSESVIYSPILSRYRIPHMSPLATSDDLSDKERFGYFSRIVSPNKFQADALIDFIINFQWNYISLLYVEGPYGENLAKVFRKNSAKKGICIAIDEMISLDNPIGDITRAIENIQSINNAEVIVTFLEQRETQLFYEHFSKSTVNNKRIILASDGLSLFQIPSIYKLRAIRTFGITLQYTPFPNSRSILQNISPHTKPDLIYLRKYWSRIFQCSWNTTNSKLPLCDPKANLSQIDFQVSGDSLEYDCLTIVVQAMKNVIRKYCPSVSRSDVHQCLSGERLLKEIRTGSFNTTLGNIQFDKNGDVYGGYNLVQYTHNGKWNVVGRWSREKPGVEPLEKIIWPESYVPVSVCSKPCPPKHYFIQKAVVCCWDCRKCRNNEIVIDNRTGCEECPEFFWPDREALECVAIEADYLKCEKKRKANTSIITSSDIDYSIRNKVEFIDNVFLSDEAKRWNLWSE
ncbi:DgyrCDS822 [Dimorphilus gyrociliatus]|uniref:DgyrCDS822 n=1 Tax=Dimorphilus gyrociliatus TaxID=2664684 RepID=A0A7I8VAA7_9ANNE|nr:DgyrCDS822 [Dimorphilus gyrociliatus]